MLQFSIDCIPVSWSAPLKGKNGFYDKKYQEKEQVRWQLRGLYRDAPLQGHVSLDFTFFIPIPKATPKARRRQMIDRRILPTCPDVTNMQKLYEDCLQGIIIENDRYSSEITSRRYYSEKPGVCIRVKKINEFEKIGDEPSKEGWLKV